MSRIFLQVMDFFGNNLLMQNFPDTFDGIMVMILLVMTGIANVR